jgi:hypothetical protein
VKGLKFTAQVIITIVIKTMNILTGMNTNMITPGQTTTVMLMLMIMSIRALTTMNIPTVKAGIILMNIHMGR